MEESQLGDVPTTFFTTDEQADPFFIYIDGLRKSLSDSAACHLDGPFTDMNQITWEQLYGFAAQLATVHPGPFCNLCERFAGEVEKRIKPNWVKHSREERFLIETILTYLPSPRHLCATIAPGCTDALVLAKNATDIGPAVRCMECTLCQSGLNWLFHQVLLDKQAIEQSVVWFRNSFAYSACADFCPLANEIQLGSQCFTMDRCQDYLVRMYRDIVDALVVLLRPERFCVLTLKWCDLGEQPNIMHCLRELCEEELGNTAHLGWICALIPDRPKEADKFLNIQETKMEKGMKDYHYAYYENFGKDEL
ncbi:unnamed protein product, partial [Mesorhabditis spiculigera]